MTEQLEDLLREAINLAAIGDIHPSDDPEADGGWGNWMKRAQALVGDPIEVHTAEGTNLDVISRMPERQVLSGCVVRSAIQVEAHELAVGPLEAEPPGGTTTSNT